MQPHEGIEDEEPWRVRRDGVAQTHLIVRAIEAERRRGDEVDGEIVEAEPAVATDPARRVLTTGAAFSAM